MHRRQPVIVMIFLSLITTIEIQLLFLYHSIVLTTLTVCVAIVIGVI